MEFFHLSRLFSSFIPVKGLPVYCTDSGASICWTVSGCGCRGRHHHCACIRPADLGYLGPGVRKGVEDITSCGPCQGKDHKLWSLSKEGLGVVVTSRDPSRTAHRIQQAGCCVGQS